MLLDKHKISIFTVLNLKTHLFFNEFQKYFERLYYISLFLAIPKLQKKSFQNLILCGFLKELFWYVIPLSILNSSIFKSLAL